MLFHLVNEVNRRFLDLLETSTRAITTRERMSDPTTLFFGTEILLMCGHSLIIEHLFDEVKS